MPAALPATSHLPPPSLIAPAPYETSFGRIVGRAGPGTARIAVRVGGRTLAVRRIRGRSFDFSVELPPRETTVRVVAFAADGRRAAASVDHVFGLPAAARPRGARPRLDPALARRLTPLARASPGVSGAYVQDLGSGAGAAWNARARFPAASTLKLAIAVEVLRTLGAKPLRGSTLDSLLRAMLVESDNDAANALEGFLAGSTSGGGHRVNALMRSLGLVDSEMYGGYLRGTAERRPIPLRVDSQPWLGRGKYTSAHDLARLLTLVHLAAEGKGLLAVRYRGRFTPSDARYLLYLLAHVDDRGKLGRYLGGAAAVLHKAGWISTARHDAGLVYWRGGVFVVVVMTYSRAVGTASDVLAGRVARAALSFFAATRRPRSSPRAP